MIDISSRRTRHVNRARVVLELKRSARPAAAIAVGFAAALACMYYIVGNVAKPLLTPTRQVSFLVPDASGVVGGGRQEITFAGIPAGAIQGVHLRKGTAEIDGALYSSFGPIYRNAVVMLRPASALQDMYLDIVNRGTRAAGLVTADMPLPVTQTKVSVQPSAVLNTFQPDVRQRLTALLTDLGGGLADRGAALQQAFAQIVPFVQLAGRLSRQLALRGQITRQFVHNADVLTRDLGDRQAMLTSLVTVAGTTLRALQAVNPALNSTLQELPPTLQTLNTSFANVDAILPDVNHALSSLMPVTGSLPAGLHSLRALSDLLGPAARRLVSPIEHLQPLSLSLKPLAQSLDRTVSLLAPQVPALQHVVKTVAGCPVAIQGFFQWTPSVIKLWGAGGAAVRGDFGFGADNLSVADPNVRPSPSCAPGGPGGGTPGATLP